MYVYSSIKSLQEEKNKFQVFQDWATRLQVNFWLLPWGGGTLKKGKCIHEEEQYEDVGWPEKYKETFSSADVGGEPRRASVPSAKPCAEWLCAHLFIQASPEFTS